MLNMRRRALHFNGPSRGPVLIRRDGGDHIEPRRRFSVEERRARLVRRHHLGRTAPDVTSVVRDIVALHSSDPSSPHLGAWARVPNYATDDLEHALVETRTLWRLHAMRRTLFIVPAEAVPVVEAAAGRDIASKERRRFQGWLAAEPEIDDVDDWLERVAGQVLDALEGGVEMRTRDLKEAVEDLRTMITLGAGKWTTRSAVASRVLFLLAMQGRIVRTRATGSWRSSQYSWASAEAWFADTWPEGTPPPVDPARARAQLARRYLRAFGPASVDDLRWWTGWTVTRTRTALDAVGAEPVELANGAVVVEGFVLPDDLERDDPASAPSRAPSVALLPGLDPTPMGWKARAWYLGDHGDRLFDRNGNVGPTVWVDGRIVGGWAQRPGGEVVYRLLEDVGGQAREGVDAEAARLTDWLEGVEVTPRFRTPLERELSEGG